MTIVAMERLTLVAPLADKARLLEELQALGCLHLVPLAKVVGEAGSDEAEVDEAEGPSPAARAALAYLGACRPRRRQIHDPAAFDPEAVQRDALAIRARTRELQDERDALTRRIEILGPWGSFWAPPPEQLGGIRLWLHVVPHYRLAELEASELAWDMVGRDNRFAYVVVLAAEAPEGVPGTPVDPGDRPLSELEARLEEVEIELDELAARRTALTRWHDLFGRSLARLEDRAALAHAQALTHDDPPVFALRAWSPAERRAELQALADARGLALVVEAPERGDTPPTLLRNPPRLGGGQELVTFYSTPGYWNWDPSVVVFGSFAAFFAMIVSDAGYALLFGLIVAAFWGRLGTSPAGRGLRRLFAVMAAAALLWGTLAGSWFGLAPPPGSLLAALRAFDPADYETMMRVSVLTGVAHLLLANLAQARYLCPGTRALGPLGWAVLVLGGSALWLGADAGVPALTATSPWLLALGLGLVVLFSSDDERLWRRLLDGALALGRIPTAFGDVLSYLRLFALGLASASLGLAFNQLAADAAAGVPGVGVLLALLIVVAGHALNFALALMSGFVHGLRLNYIEFFNWGLAGEGYPFRPLVRKETTGWSR